METPLSREELIEKIENHENVSKVDTSEIKDMSRMFCVKPWGDYPICRGENFNQPLNDWDVSNVEKMDFMFYTATSFNQPLNDWDVSNVDNMNYMFCNATSFNQPLNDWDVSNVENIYSMFDNATSFNQPLNDWNVSKIKNMDGMFAYATSFNQPLNDWNVSKIKNMERMFYDSKNYTYSFKTWKLKSDCKINNFLKGCHLWQLFNTVEDLPMQNGERINIGNIGNRKTWKIL